MKFADDPAQLHSGAGDRTAGPPSRAGAVHQESFGAAPSAWSAPPEGERWLYTVEEAADRLLIKRTKAYQMARVYLASGGRDGLPVIRLGKCLRVPAWALWVLASTGQVVCLSEFARHAAPPRRWLTGRRITVRRHARATSGAVDRPRASDGGSVRRRPRSPGGRRGGSVEQLVLVPGD